MSERCEVCGGCEHCYAEGVEQGFAAGLERAAELVDRQAPTAATGTNPIRYYDELASAIRALKGEAEGET
jgi:hypothetical protein